MREFDLELTKIQGQLISQRKLLGIFQVFVQIIGVCSV